MLNNKLFRNVGSIFIITALALLCLFIANKLLRLDSSAQDNEYSVYFPSGTEFEEADFVGDKANSTDQVKKIFMIHDADKYLIGFGVDVVSTGFGGPLPINIAFKSDGEVIGLHFGEIRETADLGSKISESAFYSQFSQKSPPLQLGADIQGISGATISSKAVVIGVNQAANSIEVVKASLKP